MRAFPILAAVLCLSPALPGQQNSLDLAVPAHVLNAKPATQSWRGAPAFDQQIDDAQTGLMHVRDGCPVGLDALRQDAGAVVQARGALAHSNPPGKGQGLELFFRRPGAPEVVQASVVVHGYSAAPKVLLVDRSSPEDMSEAFNVHARLEQADLALGRLQTEKIAIVTWVEVVKLGYADGSIWQRSSEARCRVTPNGFRLVSSAAAGAK